jgi:N-acetylglucosaminyldiphosphoundecaprenol N-acetyl-beta-D-mannosaminyltransferase
MRDDGKRNILGVMINVIDYEAAVRHVIDAATMRRPLALSALAVHGVMTGWQDRTHRCRLNAFDVLVPDGQPVRWALNLLYRAKLAERVYGPTLMLEVCREAARQSLPIYLYGSHPDVLDRLVVALTDRFPGLHVAGARPSRFRTLSQNEKLEVVSDIRRSGAAITLVGLGCPRQEAWAYEYRHYLGMPVLAVGAAFDFHAGTLPQAPEAMQRWGLEWAYRLRQEPRRLWRRYLILNPWYILLIASQYGGSTVFEPTVSALPVDELSYG